MSTKTKDSLTRPDYIHNLVETYGRQYAPALLPDHIERADPGKCFDTCALYAARYDYTYVEGVALDPEQAREGKESWILHAWLTDALQKAYDPTWDSIDDNGIKHPVPSLYLGIPMDISRVYDFMKATGYQGVLANRWRHPQLADKAIHSIVQNNT